MRFVWRDIIFEIETNSQNNLRTLAGLKAK